MGDLGPSPGQEGGNRGGEKVLKQLECLTAFEKKSFGDRGSEGTGGPAVGGK